MPGTSGGERDSPDITQLLRRHRAGDREAFDRLVGLVYQHLRQTARRQVARGWSSRTLDTTALVHEAYLLLAGEQSVDWQDRRHFFAIAARAMRRILVDHARNRGARKRGGGLQAVDLDHLPASPAGQLELVLLVDEALSGLEAFNERLRPPAGRPLSGPMIAAGCPSATRTTYRS